MSSSAAIENLNLELFLHTSGISDNSLVIVNNSIMLAIVFTNLLITYFTQLKML